MLLNKTCRESRYARGMIYAVLNTLNFDFIQYSLIVQLSKQGFSTAKYTYVLEWKRY